MIKKPTLKSNNQGLFATLRQVRERDNGVVTYHFEEEKSFNDYSQYDLEKLSKTQPLPKGKIVVEKGRTWTQSQPINKQVFFNEKGKHRDLEEIVQLFKDTADQLGAKYFTI
jgi:hypothetical protein